ncbi:MAG: RNA polymerase sigma factor [Ruminococcus sp.]|nr:RNA polymerase sigma factor [Ruminococcus sp.]
MTDASIIELYFSRSEEAIAGTKAQYGRLVRHIIAGILKSTQDVEECENDTYLCVWNTIPPNHPHSLKAYLAVIARNMALKRYEYLHAEKRNAEFSVSFEELAECICDNAQDAQHSDSELRDTINGFLKTLKADHRRVFLLRYWQGCSIEEIMQQCGFSKSKTESMLFRTRHKLRKYLTERGYRK